LNPSAIELLSKNQDKVDWYQLYSNPAIFELDYDVMRKENEGLYEELIKEVMNPRRIFKYPDCDLIEMLFE